MEMHNRGKRSIGLDASKPEGRELLLKLVESADVFLTNFLPSALQRWHLDVDDLRAANPKIIYVRGHGHGVRGPDADMPAYDSTAYWSRGGLAETLKPPGLEHPLGPRGGFGDRLGGVNLAFGIAERPVPPRAHGRAVGGRRVAARHCGLDDRVRHALRTAGQLARRRHRPRRPVRSAAADARRMNPNPLGGSLPDEGRPLPRPDAPAARPALARLRAGDRTARTCSPTRVSSTPPRSSSTRSEMVEILEPLFASKTLAEWREAVPRRALPVGAVRAGAGGARGPAGRRERLHRRDRAPGRRLPRPRRRGAVRRAAGAPAPGDPSTPSTPSS